MNKADKIDKEMLEAFIIEFPRSPLIDLLITFDKDVVVELIELFQGRQMRIPMIKTVWVSYRNKIIKEGIKENDSQGNKARLAQRFGITINRVNQIYARCLLRRPEVKEKSMNQVVGIIFRKNIRAYRKEVKKILESYGGIYMESNVLANPECQMMVKQERQALTDRCINDLNEYLIFHGKERQKERAFSMMLERLEREFGDVNIGDTEV